jgi:ribosomal protein S14
MSKKKLYKDKFLRKQYNRFEIWNKLNKSLNKSLTVYNIPEFSKLKLNKNIYSKTPIRNYCFETGRSRGVVPFFKVSRMLFRKKAGMGLFIGIYK